MLIDGLRAHGRRSGRVARRRGRKRSEATEPSSRLESGHRCVAAVEYRVISDIRYDARAGDGRGRC
jgi:hypothetical protein